MDWMLEKCNDLEISSNNELSANFKKLNKVSRFTYIIKNKIPQKLFKQKWIYKTFLRVKKLPSKMIKNY